MSFENFVRIVSTVFDKIEKVHNWLFFGQFRLMLESQPHDINVIAHIGPPLSVKWLSKFPFESLRQFLKKNCNSSQLAVPWSISAMFLKSQPHRSPIKCKMAGKISFKSLRQFLKKLKKFTIGCSLVNFGCSSNPSHTMLKTLHT